LGLKGEEVIGKWRRLHKVELYDLYFSPNIIWVFKSRRMRWVGHVAHIRDRRGAYRFLVGDMMERDHLKELSIDGSIILKGTFREWDGEMWTGIIWLRIGAGDIRL
jgi:hypothetical protein